MNTQAYIQKLVDKYHYRPLPPQLSNACRNFYIKELPDDFGLNGASHTPLYTYQGAIVAQGYKRVVVGDYGAFIEISPEQMDTHFIAVQEGQEYRIFDQKYSKNVKYEWYTINDGSHIKLYRQMRPVMYADYAPGMWYVSPYEVTIHKDDTKAVTITTTTNTIPWRGGSGDFRIMRDYDDLPY